MLIKKSIKLKSLKMGEVAWFGRQNDLIRSKGARPYSRPFGITSLAGKTTWEGQKRKPVLMEVFCPHLKFSLELLLSLFWRWKHQFQRKILSTISKQVKKLKSLGLESFWLLKPMIQFQRFDGDSIGKGACFSIKLLSSYFLVQISSC